MTIPSSVEQVTAGWLSEALEEDIQDVSILDAHSGTTGRAKIQITTQAELPETLFVKLQPFDQEQRDFLAMIGLGVSEAKLYASVGDRLPVRVPRCWYSTYDEGDSAFIMVLEDLDASGCRFASAEDDDVVDIATSLVDELGTLHSAFWGDDLDWLSMHALSPSDSPEARERQAMGAAIVESALEQFAADLPAEFERLGRIYVGHHREITQLWNEGERTLIHGDDHIGNLFVEGGRTGFYDWAVASRYPGMRDVAYFLCNSLPTEVRRSEEDRLINRYLSGLSAGGVDLNADLAREQYRLFSIYSWISATTTAAMGSRWQPAEVGYRAMERTTRAIIDLDVLGLLDERT